MDASMYRCNTPKKIILHAEDNHLAWSRPMAIDAGHVIYQVDAVLGTYLAWKKDGVLKPMNNTYPRSLLFRQDFAWTESPCTPQA
jgi:hypothetical protein